MKIVRVGLCKHDGGPIYLDDCGIWRHVEMTPSGYRAVTCRLTYPNHIDADVTCSAEPATRPIDCLVEELVEGESVMEVTR